MWTGAAATVVVPIWLSGRMSRVRLRFTAKRDTRDLPHESRRHPHLNPREVLFAILARRT